MPKPAPALGFALEDLADTLAGYDPEQNRPISTPSTVGRPRTLARDAQPVSIRLDSSQRRWLRDEAARRTLATGERWDVSRIVRELVDQARGAD